MAPQIRIPEEAAQIWGIPGTTCMQTQPTTREAMLRHLKINRTSMAIIIWEQIIQIVHEVKILAQMPMGFRSISKETTVEEVATSTARTGVEE